MAEQENNNVEQVKKQSDKKKKFRKRTIIVLIAVLIFLVNIYISCRTEYIELLEIGEEYTKIFYQNLKYKLFIGVLNFIFIFLLVCITNGFIKKGLKTFFVEEKIDIPKLPNKSLALIFALVAAMTTPNLFLEKLMLFRNNAQFGISEPIFNIDVGFYMTRRAINRIDIILYFDGDNHFDTIYSNILHNSF